MSYTIKAEISQEWLDILDVITRHQEGFVWHSVEKESK